MELNKNMHYSVVPPQIDADYEDPAQACAAAPAGGVAQSSDLKVPTESVPTEVHEVDVTAPAPVHMPKRDKKSKKAKKMSKSAQFEALYLHAPEAAPESFETRANFSTEICDCCRGIGEGPICCTALFLPCWAHGVIGDAVTDGGGRCGPCALTCGLWMMHIAGSAFTVKGPFAAALMCVPMTILFGLNIRGRTNMRQKYGIRGDCCPNDFCAMCLCQPCALAQEMRHVKDTMPYGQTFEICADSPDERADITFLQSATYPYF